MKFPTFAQLFDSIKSHPQFSNQIKLKRLKKQLDILAHYQNPTTHIQQIELTSVGIELLIRNTYRQSVYQYKLLLDFEYPFNRPMLFYLKKDSGYAQCKDLLDVLLEGSNWGPSLMLTYFLDKLQNVSEVIRENTLVQSKLLYHTGEQYNKQFLHQMQVELFQVQQYTWKYLLKSTHKRQLGLNNDTFILFSATKSPQNLTLDFWKPINQLLTAKASVTTKKKFSLEISYMENEKETKLYFGGEANVENILAYLNPIEMIERKVAQLQKSGGVEKSGKLWEDNTEMVTEFTLLIEFYSLKDPTKAEKYIKLMKQLIAKFYQPNSNQQQVEHKKMEMQKEEIQT